MSVLFGATCIIGIITMIIFMFIGIWLFIIALKSYNQLRYKNYILEKINQNLSILSEKNDFTIDNFNFDDDSIEDAEKNEDS
ncbi:MAG: hypothetical protein E7213_10230 [Clostridium sp.]|nr:hypothetical protein [Clostridium sp.]